MAIDVASSFLSATPSHHAQFCSQPDAASVASARRAHNTATQMDAMLALLRALPPTDADKLEPLRSRIDHSGSLMPHVLTVSRGEQAGALRGCAMRAAPSHDFASYSAAVAAYRKGDAAPEPSVLSSEGDAWRQLSVLLGERPVVGVMGGYFPQEAMAHYFELGAALAKAGVHLITGGGGTMAGGPVTSLLAGFTSVPRRAGRTIGIVPDRSLGVEPQAQSGATPRRRPRPL